MARKKVKLAWIANDATRRTTFKKRRRGLIKKIAELSTLCDVEACAVVYSPFEVQPEVWPSMSEARRILTNFKSLPEMEQNKKMMNQEEFLQQRAGKFQEQLRRAEKENRELELSLMLYEGLSGRNMHELRIENITSLICYIEGKMQAAEKRVEELSANQAAAPAWVEVAPQQNWQAETAAPVDHQQQQQQQQPLFPVHNTAAYGASGSGSGAPPNQGMNQFMEYGGPWNMDPSFFHF